MFGTRYRQDFEELGILGKGGYGIVYSCRHKLDGVIYAVKKVPVSESRRQQIMIRGQSEIDALLAELRTLAQLDHPNIVRYYNGWLDYINLDAPLQNSSSGDAVGGAESTRTGSISLGRVITETGDDHIMFEDSGVRSSLMKTELLSKTDTSSRCHEQRQTAPPPKPARTAKMTYAVQHPTPLEQPSATKTSNPSPATATAAS